MSISSPRALLIKNDYQPYTSIMHDESVKQKPKDSLDEMIEKFELEETKNMK